MNGRPFFRGLFFWGVMIVTVFLLDGMTVRALEIFPILPEGFPQPEPAEGKKQEPAKEPKPEQEQKKTKIVNIKIPGHSTPPGKIQIFTVPGAGCPGEKKPVKEVDIPPYKISGEITVEVTE